MRGRMGQPQPGGVGSGVGGGAQIQLKDPCGFYFAASGPEAFVFRAELFCCRSSAEDLRDNKGHWLDEEAGRSPGGMEAQVPRSLAGPGPSLHQNFAFVDITSRSKE